MTKHKNVVGFLESARDLTQKRIVEFLRRHTLSPDPHKESEQWMGDLGELIQKERGLEPQSAQSARLIREQVEASFQRQKERDARVAQFANDLFVTRGEYPLDELVAIRIFASNKAGGLIARPENPEQDAIARRLGLLTDLAIELTAGELRKSLEPQLRKELGSITLNSFWPLLRIKGAPRPDLNCHEPFTEHFLEPEGTRLLDQLVQFFLEKLIYIANFEVLRAPAKLRRQADRNARRAYQKIVTRIDELARLVLVK